MSSGQTEVTQRSARGHLEVIEHLQHGGQRPGLSLTAEGAVLPALIGQLRETLPWRPGERAIVRVQLVYS